MQKFITSSFVIALAFILSGCVTRTVSNAPENRGQTSGGKSYGSKDKGTVVETKRVWVWQDEFRNP